MTTGTTARLEGRARGLALELVAEARAEWAYATHVIARGFRTHSELSSAERRQISETVYGLIRMDRRLEAIADALCAAARLRDPLPPHVRQALKLVIYEARQGADLAACAAEAEKLIRRRADVTVAVAEDAGLGDRTGVDRDAVRLSYPTWLLERLVADLGPTDGLAIAEAMNRRAPLTLRVNTARVSREELTARFAEQGLETRPTPLAPAGLIVETRVNVFGLDAFREGLFEVMDEGSQLVAEVVAPPPGGRVVDACAGAGGKTLALAGTMGGKGRLLALDVDGKKLEELRRRARRAGLSNVAARALGPAGAVPPEARPGGWDRVLVDAPCSGLGTLRRNPEARWRLTPAELASFPPRQLALLVTYAPLCAVGGRLIYATCTVAADENDHVVDRFLAERDDFVRVPVKEIWGRARAEQLGDGLCLRLFPHAHDTDGFFAAVLRRVR